MNWKNSLKELIKLSPRTATLKERHEGGSLSGITEMFVWCERVPNHYGYRARQLIGGVIFVEKLEMRLVKVRP